MKRRILLPALALALLAGGCGDLGGNASGEQAAAPLAPIAAPNGDWAAIVSETAEGGFRMGNPEAPVKIVEYGSLGCHVCADFSTQGSQALTDNYVKTGRVSWEFRPYLLFPTDAGISMLLRCRGPEPFFQLSEQLYADQKDLMAKAQAIPPAEMSRIQAMSAEQRAAAFVRAMGVDQFFKVRGMPESRIAACLADGNELRKLAERTEQGNREGVTGTPTFFINGRKAEASSWAALEPLVRAAAR
jgi:protein-disulfide isomerase